MVEILSTLSMDNDSMRAALLFPLVDANIVDETTLTEQFGKGITYLVHGVRDMDAIRQLKATHNDSMSSEQVDNVRRMLLAMVEDFRCVVIKLAERIAHLREVKDAPEDERVLAAKECSNIYAPLANRLGLARLNGSWRISASVICIQMNIRKSPNYSTRGVLIANNLLMTSLLHYIRRWPTKALKPTFMADRSISTAFGAKCRKVAGLR